MLQRDPRAFTGIARDRAFPRELRWHTSGMATPTRTHGPAAGSIHLSTFSDKVRAVSPRTWHLATLAAGLVFILWLQKDQWFFFDEWAFLEPNHPGLFAPHVGHWSTSPLLIFIGLRKWFGLGSYFPFALGVTLIHLAAAHLTWRISIRSGANAWVATAVASVFIALGAGSENILWAFQIGYLGAIALGLFAFLLAMTPHITRGRFVTVVAIALFSLTWSGTSIPLVAATAAILWAKSGKRPAITFAAITGLVYLSWYVAFALGSPSNPATGGLGLHKVLVQMPEFIGVMLLLGFQSVFPVWGTGTLVLLGLATWLVLVRWKRLSVPGLLPAMILTGAAALFAFMSAFSRAEFSVGSGRSSRYVYYIVLLLLPLCALALSRLWDRGIAWRTSIAAALAILLVFQGSQLASAAAAESGRELGSEHVISAALYLWVSDPKSVDLTAQPDPQWAPDVNLGDVVVMYEGGQLPISNFSSGDLARAVANVGVKP